MISAYTPRGTKRKSKANLEESALKYLTNGRYDQRKSDMIAAAHKDKMDQLQRQQAKKRKELNAWAMVYSNLEALFASTFVCEEQVTTSPQNPGAPAPQTHMVSHGRRKINKKESKVRHIAGIHGQ